MAKKRPGRPAQPKPDKPWSAFLKKLCEKHGLTQAEAAARLPIALRTWISWESGWRTPRGPSLELLKRAFPEDVARFLKKLK